LGVEDTGLEAQTTGKSFIYRGGGAAGCRGVSWSPYTVEEALEFSVDPGFTVSINSTRPLPPGADSTRHRMGRCVSCASRTCHGRSSRWRSISPRLLSVVWFLRRCHRVRWCN